jgi:hypothetical protein
MKSSRNCSKSMPFRVEATAKARRDLRTIRDWLLARESGEAGHARRMTSLRAVVFPGFVLQTGQSVS